MQVATKVTGPDRAIFLATCATVAGRLGVPLEWILTIMWLESGFLATASNATGAVGLIQFTPATAKVLGTTSAALRKMDRLAQLAYVERFFAYWLRLGAKNGTFWEFYMIAFLPTVNLKGFGSDTVLGPPGSLVLRQNQALDHNKDGVLTVADWQAHVSARLARAGLKVPNSVNYALILFVAGIAAIVHFYFYGKT
jgi:hypothetical protein